MFTISLILELVGTEEAALVPNRMVPVPLVPLANPAPYHTFSVTFERVVKAVMSEMVVDPRRPGTVAHGYVTENLPFSPPPLTGVAQVRLMPTPLTNCPAEHEAGKLVNPVHATAEQVRDAPTAVTNWLAGHGE